MISVNFFSEPLFVHEVAESNRAEKMPSSVLATVPICMTCTQMETIKFPTASWESGNESFPARVLSVTTWIATGLDGVGSLH